MRTLAITGLFSPWGRRMARLASQAGARVLGIDRKPMTRPFAGVEFIAADIRNPLLPRLFEQEGVDAILHCAFQWRQQPSEEVFDSNVLGAMHLLEAAAQAGVRKVVWPSSTFIYGASPDHPAFIPEEAGCRGQPHYAYVQQLREIETFMAGFRRQYPQMILTSLRFAHILGEGVASPMARYLALPAAPVLLGFDPLLQFIHAEDVTRALGHALVQDLHGAFNVAAPAPLPLLKALALAGIPPAPLPHALASRGWAWLRRLSPEADRIAPLPWDFLRFSCVADTTRMQTEMRFQPRHGPEHTLAAFGQALRRRRYAASPSYRLAANRLTDALHLGRKAQARLATVAKHRSAHV